MAAHTIEAHQQHGADRIVRRLLDRLGIERLARLFRRLVHRQPHLRGIERGGQIRLAVDHFGKPAGVAPARALLRAFLVAQLGEEIVAFVAHPGHLLVPTCCRLSMAMPQPRGRSRNRGPSALAVRRVPSAARRAWCRVRWARGRRGCPQLPSRRSCRRRRPGHPKRWRRHGPCGGPEARYVRR